MKVTTGIIVTVFLLVADNNTMIQYGHYTTSIGIGISNAFMIIPNKLPLHRSLSINKKKTIRLRNVIWNIHHQALSSTASSSTTTTTITSSSYTLSNIPYPNGIDTNIKDNNSNHNNNIIRLSENIWRKAAKEHQYKIYDILRPGLTDINHPINSGHLRKQQQQQRTPRSNLKTSTDNTIQWSALDPKNPIYNFLIEYYGIKGTKGVKRLARWSPGLYYDYINTTTDNNTSSNTSSINTLSDNITNNNNNNNNNRNYTGIFLEGATEHDLSSLLHLRGAIIENDGILYCPQTYYYERNQYNANTNNKSSVTNISSNLSTDTTLTVTNQNNTTTEQRERLVRTVAAFVWYRTVLEQTLSAEPILYCYGLHEWAMQYQPKGAIVPPSSKYQNHLHLRVSQDIINTAVERVGTKCTHVDALRYFAPAAAQLNYHGSILHRIDQIRLEQPGCVHAHMDLLKIVLKLDPFVSSTLRQQILQIAIEARKLDIGASPYDVSTQYNVEMIPIETEIGLNLYRQKQIQLMQLVQPIRNDLLIAYNQFLYTTFTTDIINEAMISPDPNERNVQTEPGGLPWRKNPTTVIRGT